MSSFLSPLRLERIEDTSHNRRGTWRVLDPLIFSSTEILNGIYLTVPRGFITDLASVPRIPLVWYLVGGIGHAAAVIHDWLYSTQMFDRKTADLIFREALYAIPGVRAWQAELMYAGVRIGGARTWALHNQKQPKHIAMLHPKVFEALA